MLQSQYSKFLMYGTLDEYLAAYPDKTAQVPALPACLIDLGNKVADIKVTNERLVLLRMGKTKNKRGSLKALGVSLSFVSRQVQAHAIANGIEATKELTAKTEAGFFRMRDADKATHARLVLEDARRFLPELASRNVTQETLDALQGAIVTYTTALHQRTSSMAERKSLRMKLASLFRETDLLIEHDLDAMFEWYRLSDPEFYNGFKAAKQPRAVPSRSSKEAPVSTPASPLPEAPAAAIA